MIFHKNSCKPVIRAACALLLAAGLVAFPQLPARADTTITVDTFTDGPDSNTADGICWDGVDGCSLRAAIQQAFGTSTALNPVKILFGSSISGGTITLQAAYGLIDISGSYITVDGGTNNITISGASLSAGQSIFQISGSHNLLENLSISGSKWDGVQMGDFSGTGEGNANNLNGLYIFGSAASGVYISGSSSGGGSGNNIYNSRIGANASSNLCATQVNNALYGVVIKNGADNSMMVNNRIVCSGYDGIYIEGPGSNNIQIWGDFIGAYGANYASGNGGSGIWDHQNTNILIQNSVISRNSSYGILLDGTTGGEVNGNMIGTNEAGSSAYPNGRDGILITNASSNINIGSPTDISKRNIISGNSWCGITIEGGSTHNHLDGNYIGLGDNGTTAIPNGYAGVAVFNSNANYISSNGTVTAAQFISANTREGIYTSNVGAVWVNAMTYIGVAADLISARGNGLEGIKLDDNTTNGRIYPGKVMYNGLAGIAVVGDSSTGNDIVPVISAYNGGLAIDLGNDGFTSNGSHTPPPGPENWMEYPTVNMMGGDGFSGIACANCFVDIYRAIGTPNASGGGGTKILSVMASADGDFNFTFPYGVQAITMKACSLTYNCSEFSPKVNNPHRYLFLPLVKK
jgi:CSLREA domain-containing protein